MTRKTRKLQIRLYIISVAVLSIGLSCALLIYLNGGEDVYGPVGYVVVDGVSYPVALNDTKMYVRDLQRFGGRTAVLFDELGRWFGGLWHGKSLGLTIGWISALVSAGLFLFARYLPADPDSDT